MTWQSQLAGDSLTWLMEHENPGVRYLALRDLSGLPNDHPDVIKSAEIAHQYGPIAAILDAMDEQGYWVAPGPGYNPKYRSTVWSLILLAQLGASAAMDKRIELACRYLVNHALTQQGQFSTNHSPSGTCDCLQGNLSNALLDLGFTDWPIDLAFDWMARSITGEGISPMTEKDAAVRYYAGKCGPLFCCGANNKLPCAWGAVKVMLALGKLPNEKYTQHTKSAISQGIDFLLGIDPVEAAYPSGWNDKPSGNWWKFGFPVFYVTDLLQNVEVLIRLGYAQDARLQNALAFIRQKQDDRGRWPLDYNYTDKTWVDFGKKKQANPWVTLRALWVLKHSFQDNGNP